MLQTDNLLPFCKECAGCTETLLCERSFGNSHVHQSLVQRQALKRTDVGKGRSCCYHWRSCPKTRATDLVRIIEHSTRWQIHLFPFARGGEPAQTLPTACTQSSLGKWLVRIPRPRTSLYFILRRTCRLKRSLKYAHFAPRLNATRIGFWWTPAPRAGVGPCGLEAERGKVREMDGANPACVGNAKCTSLRRRGVVGLWFPESSLIAVDCYRPSASRGFGACQAAIWHLDHLIAGCWPSFTQHWGHKGAAVGKHRFGRAATFLSGP